MKPRGYKKLHDLISKFNIFNDDGDGDDDDDDGDDV